MNKEKIILQIMKECEQDGEPVTREEAEEMAEMEIKAGNIKRYEKSDAPRKKVTKERKVDTDKAFLFNLLVTGAASASAVTNIVGKNEAEFSFLYNGGNYTVKLIKHRPPKKK